MHLNCGSEHCIKISLTKMIRVILESPYGGDVAANVEYGRLCMQDCLRRGETPYASHLLLTHVVYTDRGISSGMAAGIADSEKQGIPVEYRTLK